MCRPASDTASERGAPPNPQIARGGKAIERTRASSGRRCAAPGMRKHAPAKLARPESTGIQCKSNRNARIDRETPDACADAPATPPQNAAPRPVPPNTRGGKANERPKGSSRHRCEARDLAAQPRGCASTPPPSWPVRNRQEFSANLNPHDICPSGQNSCCCTETRTSPTPPTQSHFRQLHPGHELAASETHAKPYGDASSAPPLWLAGRRLPPGTRHRSRSPVEGRTGPGASISTGPVAGRELAEEPAGFPARAMSWCRERDGPRIASPKNRRERVKTTAMFVLATALVAGCGGKAGR